MQIYTYIKIYHIYITNHTACKPLWRNHDHHSFRPTIRPGLQTTRIYIPRSWAACVRASVPWWNSPTAMLDKWRVNGGFHKWGYPQMDRLFQGKCHGKCHENGWFEGTPISGNLRMILLSLSLASKEVLAATCSSSLIYKNSKIQQPIPDISLLGLWWLWLNTYSIHEW